MLMRSRIDECGRLRLLLIAVREGRVGVDEAMKCFHDDLPDKPQREGIASYEDWYTRAKNAGHRGPYDLVGSPRGKQFLYPCGGTAAIWNADEGRGWVFDER